MQSGPGLFFFTRSLFVGRHPQPRLEAEGYLLYERALELLVAAQRKVWGQLPEFIPASPQILTSAPDLGLFNSKRRRGSDHQGVALRQRFFRPSRALPGCEKQLYFPLDPRLESVQRIGCGAAPPPCAR